VDLSEQTSFGWDTGKAYKKPHRPGPCRTAGEFVRLDFCQADRTSDSRHMPTGRCIFAVYAFGPRRTELIRHSVMAANGLIHAAAKNQRRRNPPELTLSPQRPAFSARHLQ
jgi:hypothetical protein